MAEIQVLDEDDCGERGERGKRGERGEWGERGERGHRGPRGHEGPTGSTGSTGPTGTTGFGSTGPTGPTGTAGATGATGPASSGSSILAVASVNGDGTVNANTGFSAIARTAAGQYSLTLGGSPPADAKVVPVATVLSPSGVSVPILEVVSGIVRVRTIAGADVSVGTTSDAAFYIIVSQGA